MPESQTIVPQHCEGCGVTLNNVTTGWYVIVASLPPGSISRQMTVCGPCADARLPDKWRVLAQARGLSVPRETEGRS